MSQKKKRPSVFREAWDNMNNDIDRVMPGGRQGKKKFVLWLFILEVVVVGLVGTLLYRWWTG
ncbi:MAG: hypothetical protein C0622_08545 [Desulfuromonas sp.]|nr:MAG: hypothetical protein C0622_08545 [Desulfuromonas sp.]